jgi:hypothetical protein
LVVFWNAGRWQPEHAIEVPVYFPPTWQDAHCTDECLPVSEKRVRLWSKLAGDQPVVVWHVSQVVGKFDAV